MEKISKAQVKLIRSLQQKKFRDQLGLFVAEGEKCVDELCKGFELVTLVREGENATRTEIEQMSSLRTPQGVIAVFKKHPTAEGGLTAELPNSISVPIAEGGHQLTLALDGIQDPGNLGTIIRTADWFGVHTIVCSRDTVDCYNPKVVQATMGALTRVRLYYTDLVEWLHNIAPLSSVYGTLLEGQNMYEILSGRACLTTEQSNSISVPIAEGGHEVIIMGSEGNGISQAVRPLITHPIRIPSYPPDADTSESLNVSIATAIVLAEFRRPS